MNTNHPAEGFDIQKPIVPDNGKDGKLE